MGEVRDTATVIVTETVDGTRRVRRKGARGSGVSGPVSTSSVAPALMTAARELMRPGERLVVISSTEVHLVPIRHEDSSE